MSTVEDACNNIDEYKKVKDMVLRSYADGHIDRDARDIINYSLYITIKDIKNIELSGTLSDICKMW